MMMMTLMGPLMLVCLKEEDFFLERALPLLVVLPSQHNNNDSLIMDVFLLQEIVVRSTLYCVCAVFSILVPNMVQEEDDASEPLKLDSPGRA
jgi:hypothetical protein